MSERVAVGKKVRFEVFKRDGFTCQYCGKSPPEAILELDHIKPVAKGGDDDPLNLATSCRDCNRGKSDRELSDSSVIDLQKQQLVELNEKRVQMEMMIEWREGLRGLEEEQIQQLVTKDSDATGYGLNENGKKNLRRWIKKYGFDAVYAAMETSFDQYLVYESDDQVELDSAVKAFDYIPRICSVRLRSQDKPYLKDLYYIRGILRNRLQVNQVQIMGLLEEAVSAGASVDALRTFAANVSSWENFRDDMLEFIEENRGEVDV